MENLITVISVEIIQNLSLLIITAMFAFVSVQVQKYVKNSTIAYHLERFTNIAKNAVLTVNQTYADELKRTGKWNETTHRIAYEKAMASVKKQLTPEMVKALNDTSSDINKTLHDEIEKQVHQAKLAQEKIKEEYEKNRP